MSKWIKIDRMHFNRFKIFEMDLGLFKTFIPNFDDIKHIELVFETIKDLSKNIPPTVILVGFDSNLNKYAVNFMCYDKSFDLQKKGALLPIEVIQLFKEKK